MNHLAGFLQAELERKVQRESYAEWWAGLENPQVIKVKPEKVKLSAGLSNFAKVTLSSLKP